MPSTLTIRRTSVDNAEVRTLIALHLARLTAAVPRERAFSSELSAYLEPDLVLWGGWRARRLAGLAALCSVDGSLGEIRALITHPEQFRRGVGRALLTHLRDSARATGYTRLVTKVGQGPVFAPMLAFYSAHGFLPGPALAGERPNSDALFLYLDMK